MGLLDLFRKRATREADQVWATDAAREAALLQVAATAEPATLILFQFSEPLNRFRERLAAAGVAFREVSSPLSAGQLLPAPSSPLTIGLWLPQEPIAKEAWSAWGDLRGQRLRIVVAEHHPSPEPDRSLLDLAAALPFRTSVAFHASLEEPLLLVFAAGIRPLLEKLGMTENEPIQSGLVARSIAAAQEKIRKRRVSDARTASAAEWMRLNCPGLLEEPTSGLGPNR